jgi:hypothetical protein
MSPLQQYPLRELAETLGYELGLQAVPSSVHVGGFPPPRPDRVYVLLDPQSYVAAEGPEALPDDAVLARTIMLDVKGPPAQSADAHVAMLRRAGDVFAIDQRVVVALARLGIRARLVRPGYTRSHDHFDPDVERPIDVVCLGAHTPRRARYLARAARVLARMECVVRLAGPEPATGGPSFPADGKWQVLGQTKVVINVHGGECKRLEWCRVLDAVHAGAVVVTEHSSGIAPLQAGEHLLVASADSLPFLAESLVRDPARLAALRVAAYERLSTWIPFALPVAVLRAAVVELVGEPLPPAVSLGTPRPASDPEPLPTAAGAVAGATPGGARSDTTPWRPADPEVLSTTPAWAEQSAPEVSVLTAAMVGAAAMTATLDSVAGGRSVDLEVVVAVPGSDSATREAARGWMDEHPGVAVRLVAAAGAGVGEARNSALAAARGRLCLVLDAGQEIYPRSVGALAGALGDAPDAAFAYPIQAVADEWLTSYRGWDAWLARPVDDLYSPAMIRTEALHAVGGFGVSDRDLWSAVADHGWRGELVPELLARRSEPASVVAP